MKNKTVLLVLVLGSMLFTIVSCTNEGKKSSGNGVAMDSASMAKRASDELTLLTLKDKHEAAERNAREARVNLKEAKRIDREATDAADQTGEAFVTEEKAQKSREEADNQARRADKASSKAREN